MAKLHADHYTTCTRCHKTGISVEERQEWSSAVANRHRRGSSSE